MNAKIKVVLNAVIEASLVISVILVLGPAAAFGYWENAHQQITSNAIQNSALAGSVKQIGFTDINRPITIKGSLIHPKSIREWIEYGSKFEDSVLFYYYPPFSYQGIANGHFYNPVGDLGLTDKYGEPKGQSLIERANDSTNEWSYRMAKDLYYAALTGDSTKHEYWVMRDRWWQVASILSGEENMNQEKRDRFFAWTFQAIGHTLHLIQDASVPAHTRNDSHIALIEYDPFERWTKQNAGDPAKMKYTGAGFEPWQHWTDRPDIIVPDVFIDTHRFPEEETAQPSEDLHQGLAEYSYANFLSDDSIFSQFAYPQLPSLGEEFPNYDENDVFFEEDIVNGKGRKFLYIKSKNYPQGVEHLALCGLLYHARYSDNSTNYIPLYTVDDPQVNQDYAEKLIPRAVGYSAGLLDYFFRGSIKITDPYMEFSPYFGGGFGYVTLYAENTSPEGEDMTGGNVSLVVKYKIDEKDQYLTVPAGPRDEHDEFQYIVNKLDENHSIPRITDETPDPVEFQFNLIDTPIPLNAKEIYLYLVYRGDLGDEQNDAVAVGYKDISPRKIEIGLPDTGVYALTDADPASIDPTTEGFDSLTLFAKNIAPDEQTMDGGSIQLVVKYRVAQEDQFQMPAPEPPDEFHYIVKDLQGSHTISKGTPVQFDFDLSTEEIPLWATDVYLYLIYKGKLGLENDSLCVGFKDISEPTPLDYYNSEDKICLENQYYDAGSDDAIAVVDVNNNGIADRDEWDVYAHDIQNIYIRYSLLDDPQYVSLDAYNYKIEYLGAGDFTRLFVLSDYKFNFNASDGEQIKIDSRDDFDHYGNYVGGIWSQDGLTNQVMVNESGDTNYDPNTITYIRTIPWFDKYRNIENKWFVLSFDNIPYPEDSICTFE
jgi:hypothetical protein